ncbi:hypothetical protein [uncultured virus]|uniref:Uncharacterized protein n=1 Tax=uncultured virus TaxID=340016 RepID=A0A218ML69_9VIRU|nr:hypothetical protein [uncultured virus]|tara:strand:+ start:119 stop:622 length:504 start_codon:yes stop_codon:yes gene_type:complete
MGIKSRSFLKNENRTFDNILDSIQGPLGVKSYTTEGTNLQLTNEDCGMVFLGTIGTDTGTSDGFTVFLPAPVAGAYFKIVNLNATLGNNSGAAILVKPTSDGAGTAADLFVGKTIVNNAITNVVAGVDIVTFVHNVSTCGDSIECVCDGTNWYAIVEADASGAMTMA